MNHARPKGFLVLFDLLTVVIWAWLVAEFVTQEYTHVPLWASSMYLVLLTFYATDKEVRRWRRKFRGHRHGELFVGLWVVTFVVIFLLVQFTGVMANYTIPPELATISGSVVVIYVVTDFLKEEYRRRS